MSETKRGPFVEAALETLREMDADSPMGDVRKSREGVALRYLDFMEEQTARNLISDAYEKDKGGEWSAFPKSDVETAVLAEYRATDRHFAIQLIQVAVTEPGAVAPKRRFYLIVPSMGPPGTTEHAEIFGEISRAETRLEEITAEGNWEGSP